MASVQCSPLPTSIVASSRSPERYYKAHRRGQPLTSSQKQTVMNVYSKLRQKNHGLHVEDVMAMTAELTGVSARAIFRAKKEFRSSGGKMTTPGKKRPAGVNKQTRMQRYDDFTLCAIRQKVHYFYRENRIPTAKKVCDAVNADSSLPNFSIRTMQKVMGDLGFVYKKRKRDSILIERDDIVLWRRRYLRQIRSHLKNKAYIYYLDETWLNAGHTKSVVWQDTTIKSRRQSFFDGLTTGLKHPTGKGERLIILHAGNEEGFVKGAELVFRAKKGSGDYHDEMDGPRFEKWFNEQLLPNIKPNSVLVMDNAPYHSVQLERIPTTKTLKADIQAWLTSKDISWEHNMIKKELLHLVNKVKKNYEQFRIDTVAKLHGHIILRLPPYHCELNPIELIWSQVKGFIAAENRSFKVAEIEQLTINSLRRITAKAWTDCVNHVREEEGKMWELDDLQETTVEKMEFQVNNDSSSSEFSEDDISGIEEL